MRLKQGYKEQDGCHNCARAFIKREYEDDDAFFCTFKQKGRRPLCNSVLMRECHYSRFISDNRSVRRPDSVQDRLRKRWAKWAKERSVKPWGRCAAWKWKATGG